MFLSNAVQTTKIRGTVFAVCSTLKIAIKYRRAAEYSEKITIPVTFFYRESYRVARINFNLLNLVLTPPGLIRGVIKTYSDRVNNIYINNDSETSIILFDKVTPNEYWSVGLKPIIIFIFISRHYCVVVF